MPFGEFDGPLKVGVTVPLKALPYASVPVMVTLKAVPAVCVPGLATLKAANVPAGHVEGGRAGEGALGGRQRRAPGFVERDRGVRDTVGEGDRG